MSLVVPDASEVLILRYMLNNMPATNVKLHLYTNNVTPDESDTITNYTEPSVGGYSSYALTGSGWTFATTSGTSTASFATQSFTFSTSTSIYGYYVTNNDSSSLLWAERFAGAPCSIPVTGGSIDVSVSIGAE